MKHWTKWEFKRWGMTVETRWGWSDALAGEERVWAPYQTLFSVGRFRLHCFHRGDGDPHPHDHMWDFVTFPLTSYVEEEFEVGASGAVRKGTRVVRAGRFHKRKAEHAHRVVGRLDFAGSRYDLHPEYKIPWPTVIITTKPGRIWTLVRVGKKKRDWGFWTFTERLEWRDEEANCYRSEVRLGKFVPWKDYVYGGVR